MSELHAAAATARAAGPAGFAVADRKHLPDDVAPAVWEKLLSEGVRYRRDVAVVVAAYSIVENRIDTVIVQARRAGASYRAIGEGLNCGFRTAEVRRRVEAMEARASEPSICRG